MVTIGLILICLASSRVQASGHLKGAKISETDCSDCTAAVCLEFLILR